MPVIFSTTPVDLPPVDIEWISGPSQHQTGESKPSIDFNNVNETELRLMTTPAFTKVLQLTKTGHSLYPRPDGPSIFDWEPPNTRRTTTQVDPDAEYLPDGVNERGRGRGRGRGQGRGRGRRGRPRKRAGA